MKRKNKELVILESPFKGTNWNSIKKNIQYARRCMKDCFMKGEFPFASHLLYTQEGILDDKNTKERAMGINAGLAWGRFADKTVVYIDLGISEGMKQGIKRAIKEGRCVEIRTIKEVKRMRKRYNYYDDGEDHEVDEAQETYEKLNAELEELGC